MVEARLLVAISESAHAKDFSTYTNNAIILTSTVCGFFSPACKWSLPVDNVNVGLRWSDEVRARDGVHVSFRHLCNCLVKLTWEGQALDSDSGC